MRKEILMLALVLGGCETKTGTGALVGAGVGAAAGGLIAGSGTGALIGGGVGALAGGLIGASLDAEDRKNLDNQSPRTLKKIDKGEQLSVDDVKQMSKAGIKDDVIISQIHSTGSTFRLSTADIIDLKNSGVSQNVIDAMIKS